MAIQNARILMRGGNEADFDPDKMKPKEWAVSLDQRIVRICVAPGVCIRMATYDAFEADMAQIEAILEQTKSIQEAVTLINEQVSVNAEAVAEYTEEAKQYRDEAEQFRNEAEAFSPTELKAQVEKNTVKIDTILEKGGLTFDESASGENIHIFDSTDNKATAFALYGKATQESTTGKNLLENVAESQTVNGVTFTVNEDKSVSTDGTPTETAVFVLLNNLILPKGEYILNGCPSGGGNGTTYKIDLMDMNSKNPLFIDVGTGGIKFTSDGETALQARIVVYTGGGNMSEKVFYPMIRLATETDPTYEPYTGGIASPNPDYPQEIEVAGASGSVEVKSVGKNKLKVTASSQTVKGVVFNVNEDKSVAVSGLATEACHFDITYDVFLKKGMYIFTGLTFTSDYNSMWINAYDTSHSKDIANVINKDGAKFTLQEDAMIRVRVFVAKSYSVNSVIYPMIRLASDTDATYEPYKETTATIPTPNGLPGIPVSSGGNYTDENGQQWICDSIVKYADGTGKRIQRLGKSTLDGNEGCGLYAGYGILAENASVNIFPGIKLDKNYNCRMMSNIRAWNKGNAWGVGSFGVENGIFWFEDTGNVLFPTIVDWNNYLSETNMHVLYELAEPIITDLSAEEIAEIEKLQTFYPVTNISNDAGCGMEIAYKADAKNYIDNIILARVATLETAVINNL